MLGSRRNESMNSQRVVSRNSDILPTLTISDDYSSSVD
jgi:hypothetical protein